MANKLNLLTDDIIFERFFQLMTAEGITLKLITDDKIIRKYSKEQNAYIRFYSTDGCSSLFWEKVAIYYIQTLYTIYIYNIYIHITNNTLMT